MPCPTRLRRLAPAAVLALAWIGQASASTIPTPTLPHNLEFFATSGPGPVNPGVLVGFNPQPDPPGDVARADLTNPIDPSITQPGVGPFTILFGLGVPGGSPFSFIVPPGGPSRDGLFSFLATGDGSVFRAGFDISGFAGGWVGFNPQPDPPGDFAGSFVGFEFTGDPTLHWTLEQGLLDGDVFIPFGFKSFAVVPEPATLALFGTGLAALIGVRRRREV